jgi:hypothetical protein
MFFLQQAEWRDSSGLVRAQRNGNHLLQPGSIYNVGPGNNTNFRSWIDGPSDPGACACAIAKWI